MKNKELVTTVAYEPPKVEVIEVAVEQGFAGSIGMNNVTSNPWDEVNGGGLGTN